MGGMGLTGGGPFGETSGSPVPVAVENFHVLQARQTADSPYGPSTPGRVNLLNWDGNGRPPGLFPPGEGPEPGDVSGAPGGVTPGGPGSLPGGRQDARHDTIPGPPPPGGPAGGPTAGPAGGPAPASGPGVEPDGGTR